MAKKQPANTVTAAVAAAKASATPIAVPRHVKLRKDDIPFWDGIVHARARSEWGAADLVVAAQLARCQCDIEREAQSLELEGTIVENFRGTSVMNPRVTVLEQLARREMALMRTLRLGGAAIGATRDKAPGRALQKQIDGAYEDVDDSDGLLAS